METSSEKGSNARLSQLGAPKKPAEASATAEKVVCFEVVDNGVLGASFQGTDGEFVAEPYHHLKKMRLTHGEKHLIIEYWHDTVKIMGKGLGVIYHALRRGHDVQVIAYAGAELLAAPGQPAVCEIVIEKVKKKEEEEEEEA